MACARRQEIPLLVEEVDHVGVAVTRQRQQIGAFVARGDVADLARAVARTGIVGVDEQAAARIDQQDESRMRVVMHWTFTLSESGTHWRSGRTVMS